MSSGAKAWDNLAGDMTKTRRPRLALAPQCSAISLGRKEREEDGAKELYFLPLLLFLSFSTVLAGMVEEWIL